MTQKYVGLTALMSAYVRAHHTRYDEPLIFDDSLARQMFTDETYDFLGHNLALALAFYDPERAATVSDELTAIWWVTRIQSGPIILSRASYAEECLESALRQGLQQYVILGAGMDTFAFRRPELLGHLQVFELDHPDTQALKRKRLAELGWELPSQLHLVPVDFTHDGLATALHHPAYDPLKQTFFSWLGVSYYLARDVVFTMLRDVAAGAPAGSSIVFDYLDADAFIPERASKAVQKMQEIVRYAGEPMVTGLDPGTLAADLAAAGLCLQEDLAPADIEARYFQDRTDGYHAYAHLRLAHCVVA